MNRYGKAARIFLLAFFLASCAGMSFARDFGFVMNQKSSFFDGENNNAGVNISGALIPWFAAPLGDKAELYLSGGFSMIYSGSEWKPVPEVYRSAFAFTPFPNLHLETGRIPFTDSLSHVMSGFFDGVSARMNLGGGRLAAGVFYTGLLWKKSAYIVMTPGDILDYHDKDGYFASRRVAAGINWEYAGIFNSRNTLSLSGIGQFDLNGKDARIHSQYLGAKLDVPFINIINTEFGFTLELAEETERALYAAFTASAAIQAFLPTAIPDRFALTGIFSSGAWNDAMGRFIPLTARTPGKVLRPMLSGVALAQAAYTVRPHRKVSADFFGVYYFRTDKTTFSDAGMDPRSDSPFIGGELYCGLSFSPFQDILINAGGGVFLPQTGNVFKNDAHIKYLVELGASISF
jgi:hypothetical protein